MIKMVNKMIKKSYIALNILSIILLNNNIIPMEKNNQNNQDNRDNQHATNIVNVLPPEMLLAVIEQCIISYIDNWDDIFELDNIRRSITENILNLASTCRAFNDIKIDAFRMMNNLICKKLEVLKVEIRLEPDPEYISFMPFE